MKRITYGAGSYVTSGDIADAVMEYSVALTRRREMELIDLPFVASDGVARQVRFPVGWLSDVAAVDDVVGHEFPLDEAIIERLRATVLALQRGSTRVRSEFELDSWSDFDLDALEG